MIRILRQTAVPVAAVRVIDRRRGYPKRTEPNPQQSATAPKARTPRLTRISPSSGVSIDQGETGGINMIEMSSYNESIQSLSSGTRIHRLAPPLSSKLSRLTRLRNPPGNSRKLRR